MVPLTLKEQQLDQFSQEQAGGLQWKQLRPENEVPSQMELCMLSVCLHILVQITCAQGLWLYHNTLPSSCQQWLSQNVNLVTRDYWWFQTFLIFVKCDHLLIMHEG